MVNQEPRNRYYLGELAVCYGELSSHACNACASLAGVADYQDAPPPTNDNVKKALAQMGHAFGFLYQRHGDDAYAQGQVAAALLGLNLDLDWKAERHFNSFLRAAEGRNVPKIPIWAALETLVAAAEL